MTQLTRLLQSVSTHDLNKLITAKKKLDTLNAKRAALEKELASTNKQIDSLQRSLSKLGPTPTVPKKGKKKPAKRKSRRRIKQPSLSSVVTEVLKPKKKPMSVNEIHDAVLSKGYKTRAKAFKSQLRILLYKNEKKLFRKVGPGKFKLEGGGGKKTPKKRKPAKKVVSKKKTTKKKSS